MPKVLNKRTAKASDLAGAVYVGRPTKWGNPFPIGFMGMNRTQVIEAFERYLAGKPELIAAAKRELQGRDLVCWCAPLACHASVLIRVANEE